MRYISKYKTFEKEMSNKWFGDNPKNYLIKNKKTKDNVYRNPIIIRKYKNINWEDIEVKEVSKSMNELKLECYYDHSLLTSFIIHTKKSFFNNGGYNRIHVSVSLRDDLRNIGLGYKCYKAIINKIGYVRSDEYGTNSNSRNIWLNLIKDKDYYSFEILFNTDDNDELSNGFIVFKKSMNNNEINSILSNIVKDGGEIITKDPNFE